MPAAVAAATVRLEDLTSPEVAAAIARGHRIVLVPIGGVEQSGPHLALGKHNRRAELLAVRIAGALGNALVAPVVAYVPEGTIDPPSGHMRFAGTISIPTETFVATLEAIGASLARHGFRDVVFLGDHGGYQHELARAVERLNRRYAASGARTHAIADYYRAASDGFAALLRQRGFAEAVIGRHAGLADTSLMLALDPAKVRTERLADRDLPGVDGDPTRATAALGQAGVDLIVARSADAIRNAVARGRPSAQ
jgi:creatinine amidohydrolase/Fe(II)-dependent formamide hydrolase-like protein